MFDGKIERRRVQSYSSRSSNRRGRRGNDGRLPEVGLEEGRTESLAMIRQLREERRMAALASASSEKIQRVARGCSARSAVLASCRNGTKGGSGQPALSIAEKSFLFKKTGVLQRWQGYSEITQEAHCMVASLTYALTCFAEDGKWKWVGTLYNVYPRSHQVLDSALAKEVKNNGSVEGGDVVIAMSLIRSEERRVELLVNLRCLTRLTNEQLREASKLCSHLDDGDPWACLSNLTSPLDANSMANVLYLYESHGGKARSELPPRLASFILKFVFDNEMLVRDLRSLIFPLPSHKNGATSTAESAAHFDDSSDEDDDMEIDAGAQSYPSLKSVKETLRRKVIQGSIEGWCNASEEAPIEISSLAASLSLSDLLPLAFSSLANEASQALKLSSMASSLLLRLSFLPPSPSCSLLNALSFHPTFLSSLLPHLESHPNVLFLFSSLFNYTIMGKTDSELCNISSPAVSNVVKSVVTLSRSLFMSSGSVDSTLESVYAGAALVSSTALLRSLHSRCLRHPELCDPRKFEWNDIIADTSGNLTDESAVDNVEDDDPGSFYIRIFKDARTARVLQSLPFSIPFDRRYKMFMALVSASRKMSDNEFQGGLFVPPSYSQINVRRDNLYQDSYDGLWDLGASLRNKIQVTFINEQGLSEAGIDGGGGFREFMDDLIHESFLARNLFVPTDLQTLLPAPTDGASREMEFLGRVLGKAVLEGILVDPRFSVIFLKKLLGQNNSIDDMKYYNVEFYSNLHKLRTFGANDLESTGLTFEIMSSVGSNGKYLGTARQVELIPNGSEIPVTQGNVLRYIYLVSHHKMNVELHNAVKAFLRGFRLIIPESWIKMFDAEELQKVIGGDEGDIRLGDLKRVMVYSR